jgi:hypothetical protein
VEFAAAPAHPCARGIPFILNITEKRVGVLVQYVERGEGVNSAKGVPWGGDMHGRINAASAGMRRSGRSRNLVLL